MNANELNEDTVRKLANLADLPIESGREKIILPQLKEWINNANRLNELMSKAEHQSLIPLTTINHHK